VGFGAAAGLAFIDKPLGQAKAGYGRPDVTLVGGLATENGSRGAVVGDVRQWMDDRLQTVAGVVDASVNLDFHGIGDDSRLHDHPLEYTLEPLGLLVQAKYRLGDTRCWAGLGYSFATTAVEFDAPASAPGIPDFERHTDVAGFTPSFTYDSRDNVFTPTAGDYLEASVGVFSSAFGGDDEFERLRLIAMHYTTLAPTLFLGLRAEGAATFGDEPFYMDPYLSLRGAPIMRYQGEEIAQLEVELRWQFVDRFSVVGFGGAGAAWNDTEQFDDTQTILTGGAGFRYELARSYGLHAGLDVAFSPDNAAVYLQIGSAWARP
jgi:outer membrane protein assembly factor BamA